MPPGYGSEEILRALRHVYKLVDTSRPIATIPESSSNIWSRALHFDATPTVTRISTLKSLSRVSQVLVLKDTRRLGP